MILLKIDPGPDRKAAVNLVLIAQSEFTGVYNYTWNNRRITTVVCAPVKWKKMCFVHMVQCARCSRNFTKTQTVLKFPSAEFAEIARSRTQKWVFTSAKNAAIVLTLSLLHLAGLQICLCQRPAL